VHGNEIYLRLARKREKERRFEFYEKIGGGEVKRYKIIKCNTSVAINEVKNVTNIESGAKCLHLDHTSLKL